MYIAASPRCAQPSSATIELLALPHATVDVIVGNLPSRGLWATHKAQAGNSDMRIHTYPSGDSGKTAMASKRVPRQATECYPDMPSPRK